MRQWPAIGRRWIRLYQANNSLITPRASTCARSLVILLYLAACAGRHTMLPADISNADLARPDSGPSIVEITAVASTPLGIASDLAGNEWVAQTAPAALLRINETTHGKTKFSLPDSQSEPMSVALGRHQNGMWFTEYHSNTVGWINLATHVIHRYDVPTPNAGVIGIVAGPDNAMWFTESSAGKIGRIELTHFTVSEYSVSNQGNSYPYAIALGSDGALWFTEVAANSIGRITTSHQVSHFSLPHADSVPFGITAGPDGAVWFAESGVRDANRPPYQNRRRPNVIHHGRIGRIDPSTHAISEWSVPSATSGPQYIVSRNSRLWFTEYVGNNVASIDASSHAIAEYAVPTSGTGPSAIALGTDNQLWFTQLTITEVGKLCPARSAHDCSAGD